MAAKGRVAKAGATRAAEAGARKLVNGAAAKWAAGKALGKLALGKLATAAALGGPVGVAIGLCDLGANLAIAGYDLHAERQWNAAQRINAMNKQEFKAYMAQMKAKSKAHAAKKAAEQRGGVGQAGSSRAGARPTGGGKSVNDGSQVADDVNVADDIDPKPHGAPPKGGAPTSAKPKNNASNSGGNRDKSKPTRKMICRRCHLEKPYYNANDFCLDCIIKMRENNEDPTSFE